MFRVASPGFRQSLIEYWSEVDPSLYLVVVFSASASFVPALFFTVALFRFSLSLTLLIIFARNILSDFHHVPGFFILPAPLQPCYFYPWCPFRFSPSLLHAHCFYSRLLLVPSGILHPFPSFTFCCYLLVIWTWPVPPYRYGCGSTCIWLLCFYDRIPVVVMYCLCCLMAFSLVLRPLSHYIAVCSLSCKGGRSVGRLPGSVAHH